MLHTGDCFIKNMSIPLILLVVWKKIMKQASMMLHKHKKRTEQICYNNKLSLSIPNITKMLFECDMTV